MSIRMIATDLDGTALMKGGHLSPATKNVFEEVISQGILLVIATGRSLTATPAPILNLKGLSYVITSNGSSIFHMPDRERIYGIDMHPETVRMVLDIAKEYQVPVEAFIAGRSYCSRAYYDDPVHYNASPGSESYVQSSRTPIENMHRFIEDHITEIEGMDFIISDQIMKSKIYQLLLQVPRLYITTSSSYYLEMADMDVSKASALKSLAKFYHIDREEILAFGDGINDMEMLTYAGTGVAMANAKEELKAIADDHTHSNDEDGIARYLKAHILSS